MKLSGALPADYQVGNPMLPLLALSLSKSGSQLDSGTIPPCKRKGASYGTCHVEGSSHHESTDPQGHMCLGGLSHPQESPAHGLFFLEEECLPLGSLSASGRVTYLE